jgi:hypothetical protein
MMGAFNTLRTEVTCPRCRNTSIFEIEMKIGFRNQITYQLGDTYKWNEGRAFQNGGQPEEPVIVTEGYTECPVCDMDYFVNITIDHSIISDAIINTAKPGYKQKPIPKFSE